MSNSPSADQLAPSPGITLSDDQRLAWLRLVRSENVGPQTFRDLINHFGTAATALEALPDLAAKGRSGKKIQIATISDTERELAELDQLGGKIICVGERDYPTALRAIEAAPPVLSVIGNTEILSKSVVAFVGSRNASLSGIKLTRQLASQTGQADYVIASGLARGIDAAAHEASLQTGTIAVFAGGVDHIYPHQNTHLAHDIVANGGALVSEMPLKWQPRAQDFPRRNRIVAGLSLGLVVVEAARRSGSLISARLANEMGRLVFAVPGSPLDPRSEGANHLIKQGAQLITSAQDITNAIAPLTQQNSQATYSLNEDESVRPLPSAPPDESDRQRLLSALGPTPTDVDELIRFAKIEPAKMQLLLLELSLGGQLERHPGNRVSLLL